MGRRKPKTMKTLAPTADERNEARQLADKHPDYKMPRPISDHCELVVETDKKSALQSLSGSTMNVAAPSLTVSSPEADPCKKSPQDEPPETTEEDLDSTITSGKTAEDEKFENLMSNGPAVTSDYASYTLSVARAGMRISDPGDANIWKDAETMLSEMLGKHPHRIGKMLVAMMPYSVDVFYNRVLGIYDGLSLRDSEALESAQKRIKLLADNLQAVFADASLREQSHQAQTRKFADQVSFASQSMANTVKNLENLRPLSWVIPPSIRHRHASTCSHWTSERGRVSNSGNSLR